MTKSSEEGTSKRFRVASDSSDREHETHKRQRQGSSPPLREVTSAAPPPAPRTAADQLRSLNWMQSPEVAAVLDNPLPVSQSTNQADLEQAATEIISIAADSSHYNSHLPPVENISDSWHNNSQEIIEQLHATEQEEGDFEQGIKPLGKRRKYGFKSEETKTIHSEKISEVITKHWQNEEFRDRISQQSSAQMTKQREYPAFITAMKKTHDKRKYQHLMKKHKGNVKKVEAALRVKNKKKEVNAIAQEQPSDQLPGPSGQSPEPETEA